MPITQQSSTSYTLTNVSSTLSVTVVTLGAIIQHIFVPDRNGKLTDIVLGYDNEAEYVSGGNSFYFGCLVGRVANRIGNGTFTLPDGTTYKLVTNNGPNHLHGGLRGFDKSIWSANILSHNPPTLELSLVSPDGDEGYPGELHTTVIYTIHDDPPSLTLTYESRVHGTSTVVNLTNHTYFNLSGRSDPTILNHELTLPRNINYLALDADGLPTGVVLPTTNPPSMDFSNCKPIGRDLRLVPGLGYDHSYVLYDPTIDPYFSTDTRSRPLRFAALARSPTSGITLKMHTTEPAFQFYTGNYIKDQVAGFGKHAGFCLESGRFPDAPRRKEWQAQVVITEGEVWGAKTVFSFGVDG